MDSSQTPSKPSFEQKYTVCRPHSISFVKKKQHNIMFAA